MGLTIHYNLRTSLTDAKDIRSLVRSLRNAARQFPFQRVGVLKEFRGAEADFSQSDQEDPYRWLKIQASRHLVLFDQHLSVRPTHVIAFSVQPGDGCEPANFGFCQYPARVEVNTGNGRVRQVAIQLDGWSWSSFCKTQYASSSQCGGIENFLKCHVGLCKLLDLANATELMRVEVNDESEYWEKRDVKELVNTVGEWNGFIAAYAGMFKDQAEKAGMTVEAAITAFPDFEHMEARGLDRLRRRAAGG